MNINLQAWFKQAIKAERWKEPGWILQCFCVSELEHVNEITVSLENPPQPFDLFVNIDGKSYCYWDKDGTEFIPIDGSDTTQPLLDYKGKITLNPGDLPNVSEVVNTTYGNVIVNLYACVYAFGGKVPFFTGKLKGDEIESYIVSKAVKDPKHPKPEEILPEEIDQYKKAVSALGVFSVICCATGSRDTFTVRKEVLEKRDELLKKHAKDLDNAAVVIDIEKQLLDMDKKFMGEEAENFFGPSAKLRNVGRKRQEIMYGLEGGLDGSNNVLKKSLCEGIDFEQTPLMADTITSASQSRGLLTAQGGELVKYNLRMFQNALISADDCGTKNYLPITVPKGNSGWLENRYLFQGAQTVLITPELAVKLEGQEIKLRSPGFCLDKDRNFCKKCVDANLAERPDGIAIAAAAGTNVIMQDAMKAMHGRQNATFDFNIADHIS